MFTKLNCILSQKTPVRRQRRKIVGKRPKRSKKTRNYRLRSQEKIVRKRQKKEKTSQYNGVSWDRKNGKWKARKWINGKDYNRGTFDSEYEAAQYVNVACDEYNLPRANPDVGVPDVIVPKSGRKSAPRDPIRESSSTGPANSSSSAPQESADTPVLAQPDRDPFCDLLAFELQFIDPDTRARVQGFIEWICDTKFQAFESTSEPQHFHVLSNIFQQGGFTQPGHFGAPPLPRTNSCEETFDDTDLSMDFF